MNDIEGAKTKGTYLRTTEYDSFNYADVSKVIFKTTRSVNPLHPEYLVRNEKDKVITIGNIAGSISTKLPERLRGPLDACLNVSDIHGAAAGSKRLGTFHSTSRRNFLINPNDISDIGGAQSDTLKKGVQSNRLTDPLNPDYQIPGAKEQNNIDSDPFGGSSLDPRFVAARKAMEFREIAMKKSRQLASAVPLP